MPPLSEQNQLLICHKAYAPGRRSIFHETENLPQMENRELRGLRGE